ncbi:hypothetical protein [Promicromonospora kroppenstedtii]|uniref:hypothetical protein n=1 Tax=Promicromonospora kroppenstedtii TaxID=440482 RepID=UPI0004B4D270|nr:hypothetical protein [Promicromonospora kroppenstedtii]
MTQNELIAVLAASGILTDTAEDLTVAELLVERYPLAVPVIASWIRRAYVAGAIDAGPADPT